MKTKRITVVLMSMVMLILTLQGLSVSVFAADANGTCGTNATWAYDSGTKTLTISGTGKMTDYSVGNRPWEDYIDDIENAVIESGITQIGSYFLSECAGLKSISIADSVQCINKQLFLIVQDLRK